MEEVIIDNEIVTLKKGMFGYRVIHPTKDKNGKIIWINLLIGGWGNFIQLVFILLVLFGLIYGVNVMLEDCKDIAANPCHYTNLDCSSISIDSPYTPIGALELNNFTKDMVVSPENEKEGK